MQNYVEHFIAFLDILGFKNIINSSEFEDVQKIFSTIITGKDIVNELTREIKPDLNSDVSLAISHYNDSLKKAKIYIMSDSIVVATPSIYPESLAVVADLCHVIQTQLYDMEPPHIAPWSDC